MELLKAGDRIGAYVLEAPLGSGGFASVWSARETAASREVAIKVLHRELCEVRAQDRGPSIVDRFLAEARIIERLDHPGLVQVFEVVDQRDRGIVAYVMEKLHGCDLTQVFDELDLETLIDIFAEVSDTLTFLHAEGVIHRDVKPQNIFITDPQAGLPRPCGVKLLDLGTAKELYATTRLDPTATGVLLGTILAMAPESFRPKSVASPAIDQWSLGVTMYRAFTGSAPFEDYSLAELVRKIESETPPPITPLERFGYDRLPKELETIVLRCLEKQPQHRYPTIQDVAKALRATGQLLVNEHEETLFDPLASKTEPNLMPGSMNLAPPLRLAGVMYARAKHTGILDTAHEDETISPEATIPAPPPVAHHEATEISTHSEMVETVEIRQRPTSAVPTERARPAGENGTIPPPGANTMQAIDLLGMSVAEDQPRPSPGAGSGEAVPDAKPSVPVAKVEQRPARWSPVLVAAVWLSALASIAVLAWWLLAS